MAIRQNTIQVILQLKQGQFNSVLSQLQRQATNVLSQLQRQTTNVFSKLNEQANKLFSGQAFNTAAWIQGFSLIERAGTAAFSGINNQLKQASQFQQDIIQSAGSYQSLLKVSFQEGERIAKLVDSSFAKSSLGLPNQQFAQSIKSALGDDVLGALYNPNDLRGSINQTTELLSRLSVLSAPGQGVNESQGLSLLLDAITGNYNNVTNTEAFKKNAEFSRQFDSIVESLGGASAFNKLSKQERITKVLQPLANSVSDDMLTAYRNSLSGMAEKMQSQLFGNQGIFSFSRNLAGDRTSILDTLSLELTELGEVGAKYAPQINSLLNGVMVNFRDFLGAMGNLGVEIVQTFPVIIPLLDGAVDGIQGVMTGTVQFITTILKPISFVTEKLGFAESAIYGVGYALGSLVTIAVAAKGISLLGGALGVIGGISGVAAIPAILKGVVASAALIPPIFTAIGIAAKGAFVFLLTNPIGLTITAIAAGAFLIYKNWDKLKPFFSGLWRGIKEGAQPVINIFSTIAGWVSSLVKGFSVLGNQIKSVVAGLQRLTNINLPDISIPSFSATQSNNIGRAVGKNVVGSVASSFGIIPAITSKLLGFADGNDPYGVFAAMVGEQRRMPSGAKLAVANTSEMILNRDQQQQLLSSRGVTISPIIHISGVTNPNEVADIVINKLNTLLQSTKMNYV